ncbi:MAG: hypothetical protein LCH96_04300 [Actinobacteria bacterium]|nr:hypothetical protein [Actinomycetota bacterium]
MEQFLAALDGSWRVLAIGMLLGAGLPAVFALGLRALSWGTGHDVAPDGTVAVVRPHPLGRVVAYLMFTFVVLAVLVGITYIALHGLGWTITFNGAVPVLTHK